MNKTLLYIKTIQAVQSIVSITSVVLFLFVLPVLMSFIPELIDEAVYSNLYFISLMAVSFVMVIRPLADLLAVKWVRSLVILRKSFGILSASIIVGFACAKIIQHGGAYITDIFTVQYWSFEGYKFLAHLGDVTGFILLATSNKISKKLLKQWWKRIQKLAYVYFYSGALYEVYAFGSDMALVSMIVVTTLVLAAYIKNNYLS